MWSHVMNGLPIQTPWHTVKDPVPGRSPLGWKVILAVLEGAVSSAPADHSMPWRLMQKEGAASTMARGMSSTASETCFWCSPGGTGVALLCVTFEQQTEAFFSMVQMLMVEG